MLVHLSDRRLNQFADGDLAPRARARAARHLRRCERCRRVVATIRAVGAEARGLVVPPLPRAIRDRVLTSISAGEEVIVPVADPVPDGWPWQRLLHIGSGALLAALVLRMLLAPSELLPEAAWLEITPPLPPPGGSVEVAYHATGPSAHLEQLTLRARYRGADDPQYGYDIPTVWAGTLTRDGGNVFRGTVQLPPDAVYAALAIEDSGGRIVDSHRPIGWELLTGRDGRPSADALLQQSYEAMGRDFGLALQAAVRATERAPERIAAWALRSALEQRTLGSAAYDSLRAAHLPRLLAMDAALSDQTVDPDVASGMYFYAMAWDAEQTGARWRRRLLEESPRSPAAVQLRTVATLMEQRKSPDRALRSLEELWAEVGARHVALPQMAFEFALDARRAEAMLVWAPRWLEMEPRRRRAIASALARTADLRSTALLWLAQEAERLQMRDDARRPLHRPADEQRRLDRQGRREILGVMGRLLLAAGDVASARALLDSATAEEWNSALFRDLARAWLQAGDTLRAVELLADVAADPAATLGDFEGLVRSLADSATWVDHIGRARERMIAATLHEARPQEIRRSVTLTGSDGKERDLRELLGGRIGVAAFFWPRCVTCLDELQQLQALGTNAPVPVQVLLITRAAVSAQDVGRLRAHGIDLPVLFDARQHAAAAFGFWGTSAYFVLDRRGIVQFPYTNLRDVPRQLIALARAASPVLF